MAMVQAKHTTERGVIGSVPGTAPRRRGGPPYQPPAPPGLPLALVGLRAHEIDRGLRRPVRIAKRFAAERHQIGLTRIHDSLGVLEIHRDWRNAALKLIRLCGALHSRIISTLVSVGAAGAGLLWAAFDRDGLSVHDRLSGTVLEMVPPGR